MIIGLIISLIGLITGIFFIGFGLKNFNTHYFLFGNIVVMINIFGGAILCFNWLTTLLLCSIVYSCLALIYNIATIIHRK